ncbi:MAG: hypothetical protein AUG51_16040 [Acidobacteria bacterium 13_1_20CM_3_53_8]|nr:MAG: hypothetical protein AUG51_16040 [Acidobacteria bacterium 13_1_20CM_3_53_8]
MLDQLATLQFERLDENAVLPTRDTLLSAGLDISCISDLSIEPKSRTIARTGLAVAIPEGFYGRLAPRSGFAVNDGLDVLAGVIDADYRGEIICVLYNTSDQVVELPKGSKVCQLILEKIVTPKAVWAEKLERTSRGNW